LTNVATVEKARPGYSLPRAAFIVGIVLFTANNIFYISNLSAFYEYGASPLYSYTSALIIALATISLGVGAFSFLRMQQKVSPVVNESNTARWPLGRIISDAVFLQKKLVVSATVVYALFFALLDGILVYQPNVNFAIDYAVNSPAWRVATCCGTPAYVPVGLLYLPAQHVGVELFPLSVLLMLIVSLLVGLNLALLVKALRLSRSQDTKGAAGSVLGAAFGLFAGCPTCAAAFFLSMIAGAGATAFSTIIAQYQPLIVSLTLPLLFFSIYYQAKSIGSILQGCAPEAKLK